jgi:hypothetical protein
MKRPNNAFIIPVLIGLLSAVTLSACVQMPTEEQSVVDLRPQIAFRITNAAYKAEALRVFVDNLDMGTTDKYLEGKGALRILPGTHLVRVENQGQVVLSETVYVADGVARTFVIN